MKTNPGGRLAPDEVIGREQLIDSIWRCVSDQSLIINAERRIGKTSILQLLQARPRRGWVPVLDDLEKIQTALEFSKLIYAHSAQFLGRFDKQMRNVQRLLSGLSLRHGDTEATLPNLAPSNWKDLLIASITDLEEAKTDQRLLFLWDEVPYMLTRIAKGEGDEMAMAVLDTLRSLRQMHPRVRMILTGSIGLHHVINDLKKKGHINAAINDVRTIEVSVLEPAYARRLARELLTGEGVACVDPEDDVAAAIAELTDGFPYYIHHLVAHLTRTRQAASTASVQAAWQSQLRDPDDPWQLRHYNDRIDIYYPSTARTVRLLLDELAIASREKQGRGLTELLDHLKQVSTFDDRETLKAILNSLARDHYVSKCADNRYIFKWSFLAGWWLKENDL